MKVRYFFRRRVYGRNRQWFSWLYYSTAPSGDYWKQIQGDPWPVRTPPKDEIRQAIGQELGIPPDSIELELKR